MRAGGSCSAFSQAAMISCNCGSAMGHIVTTVDAGGASRVGSSGSNGLRATTERPVPTLAQVFEPAEIVPPRYRALALRGSWHAA